MFVLFVYVVIFNQKKGLFCSFVVVVAGQVCPFVMDRRQADSFRTSTYTHTHTHTRHGIYNPSQIK